MSLKKFIELDRDTLSAVGKASVIGLHMVSGVAVGCGLGWLLDWLLGTKPWLLLVFFVLGVAAGFRNVWMDTRIILRVQARAEQGGASADAINDRAERGGASAGPEKDGAAEQNGAEKRGSDERGSGEGNKP